SSARLTSSGGVGAVRGTAATRDVVVTPVEQVSGDHSLHHHKSGAKSSGRTRRHSRHHHQVDRNMEQELFGAAEELLREFQPEPTPAIDYFGFGEVMMSPAVSAKSCSPLTTQSGGPQGAPLLHHHHSGSMIPPAAGGKGANLHYRDPQHVLSHPVQHQHYGIRKGSSADNLVLTHNSGRASTSPTAAVTTRTDVHLVDNYASTSSALDLQHPGLQEQQLQVPLCTTADIQRDQSGISAYSGTLSSGNSGSSEQVAHPAEQAQT
ncbi:unnamed protein product, partial [Amoebophrya sp. A120]